MSRVHEAAIGGILGAGLAGLVGCAGSASLSSGGANATAGAYAVDATEPEERRTGGGLGELHVAPEACSGLDMQPVHEALPIGDLARFLEGQGLSVEKTKAREDLHYFDVQQGSRSVRLRVATLPSARAAGRDLHEAMLEHGMGSWGVHRSNLAVLGPVSDPDDIVAFALQTKLACWGVLSIAGRDDNFVIPGGYTEL